MLDVSSQQTAVGGQQETLCVELDHALLDTDLFWECILRLLRQQPLSTFLLPIWLLRGRAHLKRQLAIRVRLDVEKLPYRPQVVEYLRDASARGSRVILLTDEDALLAGRIAEHTGLFSDVLASDGRSNLSGSTRRSALTALLGGSPMVYVGGPGSDAESWRFAQHAILVGGDARALSKVRRVAPVEQMLPARTRTVRDVISALRVHQWVKNTLVFVPVVLDHRLLDWPVLASAGLAFLAFSLAASGGYVLNDVLDAEADRRHPTKRERPFAAGVLSPGFGVAMLAVLYGGAALLSFALLPALFSLTLVSYIGFTSAYSLFLKRMAVVDVMLLAGLYTLRILAGVAATGVRFSTWLLAFSMFLFLSLAFMKRYAEFARLGGTHEARVSRRGYRGADLDWLRSMGGSSGYLSVLVLALYISSDEVTSLYSRPYLLWLICPLLLFWITRMWFRAHRGKLAEDPIVAAARDRASYVVGACVVAILMVAA